MVGLQINLVTDGGVLALKEEVRPQQDIARQVGQHFYATNPGEF